MEQRKDHRGNPCRVCRRAEEVEMQRQPPPPSLLLCRGRQQQQYYDYLLHAKGGSQSDRRTTGAWRRSRTKSTRTRTTWCLSPLLSRNPPSTTPSTKAQTKRLRSSPYTSQNQPPRRRETGRGEEGEKKKKEQEETVTASSHSIPSKAVQNTYLVRSCRSRVHNKLHATCRGYSLSRAATLKSRDLPLNPTSMDASPLSRSLSLSLSLSPCLSVSLLCLTLLSFHGAILPFLWRRSAFRFPAWPISLRTQRRRGLSDRSHHGHWGDDDCAGPTASAFDRRSRALSLTQIGELHVQRRWRLLCGSYGRVHSRADRRLSR